MKVIKIEKKDYTPTRKVTFQITRHEAEAVSHAIACGPTCAYPKMQRRGKKVLDRLQEKLFSHCW